jgi:hypothetical protein
VAEGAVVVVGEFEHVGLYAVSREQAGAVLAACRRADTLARAVAARLDAADLGDVVRDVVGVLDEAGQPIVRVTITLDGARRLARLMDAGPGPLSAETWHPPPDPDGPDGASEAA